MKNVKYVGGMYVGTEPGEVLDVRAQASNKVMLSNGDRVQVKRYWTASAIATGASDTTIIAAPADAQHNLVVLAYTVMCDATTLVTFRSDSTTIGMPLPCAANGGITRLPTGQPLLVCVPGTALAVTTSGGNTYMDVHYIEVPIDVDIL